VFNLFKGSNAVVDVIFVHLLQVLDDEADVLAHLIMNADWQWKVNIIYALDAGFGDVGIDRFFQQVPPVGIHSNLCQGSFGWKSGHQRVSSCDPFVDFLLVEFHG
jgi:hypothetical protein